jgi:hypothetical protein
MHAKPGQADHYPFSNWASRTRSQHSGLPSMCEFPVSYRPAKELDHSLLEYCSSIWIFGAVVELRSSPKSKYKAFRPKRKRNITTGKKESKIYINLFGHSRISK